VRHDSCSHLLSASIGSAFPPHQLTLSRHQFDLDSAETQFIMRKRRQLQGAVNRLSSDKHICMLICCGGFGCISGRQVEGARDEGVRGDGVELSVRHNQGAEGRQYASS